MCLMQSSPYCNAIMDYFYRNRNYQSRNSIDLSQLCSEHQARTKYRENTVNQWYRLPPKRTSISNGTFWNYLVFFEPQPWL